MQRIFITASGTGVGKTLVTTSLCWQLRQKGKNVTALKPVITGYDPKDTNNDTALILKSCGLKPEPALMETISPWQFSAPLSPNLAAAQEKVTLSLEAILKFCRDHASLNSDVLLVEGAGGVMVPLNDMHTILDWMAALAWPVILVGGSYLGSLSHTLTAHTALASRGLTVKAIVINASEKMPVPLEDTATTLEKFLPKELPIVKIPRLAGMDELWKQAPPLDWIMNE